MSLQTEFEFTLPRGFVDEAGVLHKRGIMRLATAMDEVAPLRDPRVRANQAYLGIILLSRVIVKLGALTQVTPDVIEKLYSADFTYLETFYRQINDVGFSIIDVTCPECKAKFEMDLAELGGS